MPKTEPLSTPAIPAWANRFVRPSVDALMADCAAPVRALLQHLRDELRGTTHLSESIHWQGVWKWSLIYTHDRAPDRVFAFIIPSPANPRCCLPLPASLIAATPPRRLSRHLRDTITAAATVDDTQWPTWPIASLPLINELIALLRHHAHWLSQRPRPIPAAD